VTDAQAMLHFAEFGVVLMLFLVGLELEPKRLWALRRPIFGWGAVQTLGSAVLMVAAAVAFGIDWRLAVVAGLRYVADDIPGIGRRRAGKGVYFPPRGGPIGMAPHRSAAEAQRNVARVIGRLPGSSLVPLLRRSLSARRLQRDQAVSRL
jgi:hypothetical protein